LFIILTSNTIYELSDYVSRWSSLLQKTLPKTPNAQKCFVADLLILSHQIASVAHSAVISEAMNNRAIVSFKHICANYGIAEDVYDNMKDK